MKSNTLLSLLGLLLLSFYSCSNVKQQKEQPNIVWITSEDNSKHYLTLYDEHGIATPNIEALADKGLTFNNAFSNSCVCSAARSTLISGCYGPRAASHYHRSLQKVPMPKGVEMFPAYLRLAGYYTANNFKEDYNFFKSDTVWDDSSRKASWRNRKDGQPFFYVQNIMTTHESRIHFSEEDYKSKKTNTDPEGCFVQPNHPKTDLMKYTNAFYRDKIVQMDSEVGEIVKELEKDGLLEETIVFYFSDHGGVLPGSKGYIYETGLEVPLVVYVPEKYKHLVGSKLGSRIDGFVNFVDFGATVLSLAGVDIPKGMDGVPFLGKHVSLDEINSRDVSFSYTDRMDEKYDMVRAIRKGKYKYMRNFNSINFDGLMNNYRYIQLAYQEWRDLFEKNELNPTQSQFFMPKQPEALYDVEADPFETNNLAAKPEMKGKLMEMRKMLFDKMVDINDLAVFPEFYLIKNAFDNPVAFGTENKANIKALLEVANLQLKDYSEAKKEIDYYLQSNNPWERYWALNACSTFGKEANEFARLATAISRDDKELINRVKAAEYLAIANNKSPVAVMTNALYNSSDPNEALQILNSIVLMQDGFDHYHFDLNYEKIDRVVRESQMIKWRLDYLGVGPVQ